MLKREAYATHAVVNITRHHQELVERTACVDRKAGK
jgi:hypothetical protein